MYSLQMSEAKSKMPQLLHMVSGGEGVEILCEDGSVIKMALEMPIRHKTANMYEGLISMTGRFEECDYSV